MAGVLAERDGKPFYVQATKGVLIATGGFQYNKALMEKYNPLMAKVTPAGGAGSTGDGLLMAQAYGADVLDTNYIKATFGYQMTSHPNSLHAYYSGAIVVNHAGKRFVDESISYKLISDAALGQPDKFTFQLFDEKVRSEMGGMTKRFAEILDVPELKAGKDTPYCFAGQTLEEVATKAGVDPEGLQATVAQYNADVEKGKDSQFGRTSLTSGFGQMKKIETPPFFLYPSVPRCIATYCGIKIDPRARVIDVFGEPIPGLYACGEATGGVHGAAYMTGTAFGKAFSFGRLAALDIAKN
ncbi:FAD-dependent oxidoreductase [Turicimonas sp. TL08]